ncbi:NAD-dependent succinate-semialdehyde dehydrogenase [Bradyrhizobium sp. 2]|uniref:NAD-dependent succinate-semialdehyde dehydrogenase n=1 Tax=unclassified Bradyrhizobium TaxID=2631580 RepID=UPI001FF97D7D|nr:MULTISPECIES: NAD-dependent succinate-semialdehyde dehydrogenase [unclassified Bradyrhizobium]MCK1447060.1 NAD-dependent succinate-semialdehyde dehydrogenase [Bradyrhizobium sp. 48]MCK1464841.1 NAD-dependent succinate-semialdehyde dehydrogenase [Bradyrhizobium sp. 2]
MKSFNFLEVANRCLVDGQWVGEPVDPVLNPATGAALAKVPCFGGEMAEEAVNAAGLAFGSWSTVTAGERARLLHDWFAEIIAHKERLARLLTMEQGKPLREARAEVEYAASFVRFYAEEARRIYGETIPSQRRSERILIARQAVGVMAAITPWNFPAAMVTRKVAPALAAGCTVVLKPAPETPLTALALAFLAQKVGFPAGVFNVVTGDAVAIGKVMTEHPKVRAVSFTGSTEVGKLLMRQAAGTVKRVGLELGGNAPFIVFDDADIDAAVDGLVASKFRNMGQTCVCVNRIYVQAGIHDAFVDRLKAKIEALSVGNGMDEEVTQGPLINKSAVLKIEQQIEDAVRRGAKIIVGGRKHRLGGTYFEPTLITDVSSDMLVTREETFGPLAPVYRFSHEADVIKQSNDSPAGLASYFYTRDLSRAFRMAEALQYGMVGINSVNLSVENAPFGGVKESGLGREGSRHGIEEYTDLKFILIGGLQ